MINWDLIKEEIEDRFSDLEVLGITQKDDTLRKLIFNYCKILVDRELRPIARGKIEYIPPNINLHLRFGVNRSLNEYNGKDIIVLMEEK